MEEQEIGDTSMAGSMSGFCLSLWCGTIPYPRRALLSWLGLSVCILATIEILNVVYQNDGIWPRLALERPVWFSMDTVEWCEAQDADLDKFMIEPANARSDYSFMIAGVWMIVTGWMGRQKKRKGKITYIPAEITVDTGNRANDDAGEEIPNALRRFPLLLMIHGIFNILHGIGSWGYHSCECALFGRMDVAGMVAIVGFYSLYPVVQLQSRPHFLFSLLPSAGQAILYGLVMKNVIDFEVAFIVLMVINLSASILIPSYLLLWRSRRTKRKHFNINIWLLVLGWACFFLGYFIWILDTNGTFCIPSTSRWSWIQGHALWHVLTCVTIVCSTLVLQNERILIVLEDTVEAAAEELNIVL